MTDRILRKLSLERLPRRYRALATEAIEAEAARASAEAQARRAAVERAADEHRRSVLELVGERKLRALGEALRQERSTLRALRESGVTSPAEVEKAVRAGRKRLASAARALGVDLDGLRRLGAVRARRLEKATVPAAAATGRLIDRNSRRGKILPLEPPDQVITPPFPIGVQWHDSDSTEGFSVGSDWDIDEPTGRITARTWMRCPDADWWNDYAWVWIEAALVFVYTAPATGRLSVVIDATSLESSSRLRLKDEFGFSGSETHMRNFLTLHVFHPFTPGFSSVETGHFTRTGTGGNFAETARYPGSRYLAALDSPGTVQEGDTFFVAVGTQNYDRCSTDDVEVDSHSDWSWVINSLELRMFSGGPIFTVGGRALAAGRRGKRRAARR